jgi:DNA (cytosine-5)-methyltransferase 1
MGELLSNADNDRCGDGTIQHIGRQLKTPAYAGNDGEEVAMANATNKGLHERRGFDGLGEDVRVIRGNEWDGIPGGNKEENSILADTNNQRLQGSRESESAKYSAPPSDWQAAQSVNGGASNFWAVEPQLGRVAHGVPNRVGQLKGYGNAQVPLQAATA